jgi:exodeoxyribonuclease-3
MALHDKLDAMASLHPDVAVICECAKPETIRAKSQGRLPESVVWVGENEHKGLAVIGMGPWRVRLDESYDPSIRHVVPVHVDGPTPFRLLAVWAFSGRANLDEMGRGPLALAMTRYEGFCKQAPLVVAGDFNNNAIWNNPKNPTHGHLKDVASLAGFGLFSAYHHQRNVAQGQEPEPTHYWRNRKVEGPTYHLDYIFAPVGWKPALRGVEVGEFGAWVGSGLSDHVPLIADFECGRVGGAEKIVGRAV